MSFEKLAIMEPVLQALQKEGYIQPTLIQEKSIPVILHRKDMWDCALTPAGELAVQAQDLQKKTDRIIASPGRSRAGAQGKTLSFCDPEEVDNLRSIQRLLLSGIPVVHDHKGIADGPKMCLEAAGRNCLENVCVNEEILLLK